MTKISPRKKIAAKKKKSTALRLPSSSTQPAKPAESAAPHIKIAAHVVIQLGQELVTDVEQAFLELAKNAYDADSGTCEIDIEPPRNSRRPIGLSHAATVTD